MPAGTIALTNGSNAVTGTGTSFTTELKQGDFVYVTVGSAPYTLVVSSVTSNTQLILSLAFDGPTTSGLAWNAVPASMQVAITQKILNDFAQVARGRILDFQNWQKIYSGDASVTVTRPDRTTFTGPSWGYMATQFGNKLDKTQNLNDVGDKTTAWNNIARYGSTDKTAAAGNDARLDTVNGKTGGTVKGSLLLSAVGASLDFGFGSAAAWTHRIIPEDARTFTAASTASYTVFRVAGGYACKSGYTGAYGGNVFNMNWNSSSLMELYVDGSRIGTINTTSVSDKALKTEIAYADSAEQRKNALTEVLNWRPAFFRFKQRGIIPEGRSQLGFIANDLVESSKECVSGKGLPDDFDVEKTPNDIDDAYSPDMMAMIAKLTLCMQELSQQLASKDEVVVELQNRMKAIDGLDA